jgi:gliding motility-associated-like protein
MPPVGLSNPYISNPTLMPSANTRYFVYGTTIDGCKTADSVDVYLNNESAINLPNAFTPGKANNYEFKVMLDGVASLNYFKIYNRWGNLMFETNSISKGWDGSYNGEPQPFGVYVYEVEAVTTNGTIVRRKGNVTLLR